jgi:hypothetical protein
VIARGATPYVMPVQLPQTADPLPPQTTHRPHDLLIPDVDDGTVSGDEHRHPIHVKDTWLSQKAGQNEQAAAEVASDSGH